MQKIKMSGKKQNKSHSTANQLFSIPQNIPNSELYNFPIKNKKRLFGERLVGKCQKPAKPDAIKRNEFFKKAIIISHKKAILSHKEAIKNLSNNPKKNRDNPDNLKKAIQSSVVVDNSLINEYVPDILCGVEKRLKYIASTGGLDNLENDVFTKISCLANYTVKDINTKNLSKKQRLIFKLLKSNMENTVVGKMNVLNFLESHVKNYIVDELQKYFSEQKILVESNDNDDRNVADPINQTCAFNRVSDKYAKEEERKEELKYKYIKKELNNLFFDNLKQILPKKSKKIPKIPIS